MNKLSIKESHIYVTQSLQRQGAYRKDKQYPAAIDLALTKAQNQIVKARLVPDANNSNKFEINSKYASDIQTLIKRDVNLTVFKAIAPNKSYGMLPYDFSYLLSDSSTVIEDCKASFTNPTQTKAERVISLPFVYDVTPYGRNIIIGVSSVTENITTVGVSTTDEIVYLVDYILDAFKQLGVDAYWEDYHGLHRNKCFLVVTQDLTLTANITVDGKTSNPINIDTTYTVFKSPLADPIIALNRDVRADFVQSALVSMYHRPVPTSPLATLSQNQLIVYCSERFLVNKISIDYVRKPKRMNLALNQGSELSDSVHEEICDVAVKILKKQIEDQSYQLDAQDVKERITQ